VDVPEEELVELRRRIAATRWPEKETVADQSQGVQLATMQALAQYWETEYDFRRFEARLNALPQFMTEIDGVDIHFIHVRSQHEDALPLIITHGWPGSVVEMLNVASPLPDPTAHGGDAADAFDVVIPSMPGYGFSAKPEETGWDAARMARAWVELMRRLGYTRFVAQGGVGAVFSVAGVIDHQHPLLVGRSDRVGAQQLDPPLVDRLVVPGRLRQEPLQPLHLAMLGTGDRLGAGQSGQGLVAVSWQQQALQVVPQAAALRQAREQGVELAGVVLQRAGCGWTWAAGSHRRWLLAADRTPGVPEVDQWVMTSRYSMAKDDDPSSPACLCPWRSVVVWSLVSLSLRRAFELLLLCCRLADAKEIEILVLRHEFVVLHRQHPRLRLQPSDLRCCRRLAGCSHGRAGRSPGASPRRCCAGAWSADSGPTRPPRGRTPGRRQHRRARLPPRRPRWSVTAQVHTCPVWP
jgi:pimeloyl-ACP methyl ester carboxylesterase